MPLQFVRRWTRLRDIALRRSSRTTELPLAFPYDGGSPLALAARDSGGPDQDAGRTPRALARGTREPRRTRSVREMAPATREPSPGARSSWRPRYGATRTMHRRAEALRRVVSTPSLGGPRVVGPMVAPSGHSLAASVPLALPELAFCALCRRSLHDAPGRGDSRHEATTARRIPMPCTPPDGARGFIAPLGSFALPRGNDPRPCGAFALIQFLSIGHPEQLHGACLSGGSVIRWVTIPPPVRVPIGRPPGSRSRRRVDHVEGAAEGVLKPGSLCVASTPGTGRTRSSPLARGGIHHS